MFAARAARLPAFETEFSAELAGRWSNRNDLITRLEKFAISRGETAFDLANRAHSYPETLAWIARNTWSDTPDAVPADTLAVLEPGWRKQLSALPVVVGGRGSEVTRRALTDYRIGIAPERATCLLMLPTPAFMGWNFGDMSDLAFYMTPDALATRAWDTVVAVDTHGS